MQRYFSHICDGTDVQADRRRSCTCGRAHNVIDISQGSLTGPSYTGPPFLYGGYNTPPKLVAFYDTLGIRRTNSPPRGRLQRMRGLFVASCIFLPNYPASSCAFCTHNRTVVHASIVVAGLTTIREVSQKLCMTGVCISLLRIHTI